jgi:hypothetical protein
MEFDGPKRKAAKEGSSTALGHCHGKNDTLDGGASLEHLGFNAHKKNHSLA